MRVRTEPVLGAVVVVALGAACGARPPEPTAWIPNGGVDPDGAHCDEIEVRFAEAPATIWPEEAEGCAAAAASAVPMHVAFAYYQAEPGDELTGPVIANEVSLGIFGELVGADGAFDPALVGGDGAEAPGFASGDDATSVALAGDDAATFADLAGGDSGSSAALAADDAARGGELAEGDAATATTRSTVSRDRSAVTLHKAVAPDRVREGERAVFTLRLRNGSGQAMRRIFLVDRIDPRLRVTDSHGAETSVWPDGSTVILFEDGQTLVSGGERSYVIGVSLR